jgi:hypothetical protein
MRSKFSNRFTVLTELILSLHSPAVTVCTIVLNTTNYSFCQGSVLMYRGADKSLARPGRKQATATEDFEFHIFYL